MLETTSQLLFGDGTLNFKTENVAWFSCWFFEWLTWRRFCSQIWRWHAYWEETTKHNAKQLLMLQNGEKHKREPDGNQTNWCCEVPQLRIHRCPLPEFPPLVSKPGESTKEGTPGTCWFLKPWRIESFKNRMKYNNIRWNLVLVVEHPPLPAILWCEQQRTSRSWQFLLSDLPHLCWQPAIEVVTCPLLRYPQEKRNRRWRTDMPVSQVGSRSLCLWLVTRQESKLKPHLVVVQGQCAI